MAAILISAGCCSTHPEKTSQFQPVLTADDAYHVATIYMIGHYGVCGSRATEICDCGDYWSAQTAFGFAPSPGPELHIDKKTRKITVIPKTVR